MAFRIFGSHIKETWKSKVHVYPFGFDMRLRERYRINRQAVQIYFKEIDSKC